MSQDGMEFVPEIYEGTLTILEENLYIPIIVSWMTPPPPPAPPEQPK